MNLKTKLETKLSLNELVTAVDAYLRPSYFRYFSRGQSEKPSKGDFLIMRPKKVKLAKHDKLLKKFHHKEALVSALRAKNPENVVAVMEELVSRKKLLKCVANLDVEELGVLLFFLKRYSTMPRYANMLIKLAQKVVESRIDDINGSEELKDVKSSIKIDGRIQLKEVDFFYLSRPTKMTLNGLSLKIDAGEIVALVGTSGSGKSTIIGLIQRFCDPCKGSVEVDGIDINCYDLRASRSCIAWVSQEPTLFAETIKENIAYGKENATEAEIIQAASLANIHEFISVFAFWPLLPSFAATFTVTMIATIMSQNHHLQLDLVVRGASHHFVHHIRITSTLVIPVECLYSLITFINFGRLEGRLKVLCIGRLDMKHFSRLEGCLPGRVKVTYKVAYT
ncbi:AAA+ ATPase domain-containing protein [Artemisia annua]|uniref:AAA+ ATPase domain-containing protein n=1 Tax=Artemisia annua TaxID=35608 RepID=A0A2U1N2E9_ARTAN|nr:AAA+ ATPase domain-containing protein [Artemisia annua]